MTEPRDEFLSEEDLDLANLSEAELDAWCGLWLRMAQATNDLDEGRLLARRVRMGSVRAAPGSSHRP